MLHVMYLNILEDTMDRLLSAKDPSIEEAFAVFE